MLYIQMCNKYTINRYKKGRIRLCPSFIRLKSELNWAVGFHLIPYPYHLHLFEFFILHLRTCKYTPIE